MKCRHVARIWQWHFLKICENFFVLEKKTKMEMNRSDTHSFVCSFVCVLTYPLYEEQTWPRLRFSLSLTLIFYEMQKNENYADMQWKMEKLQRQSEKWDLWVLRLLFLIHLTQMHTLKCFRKSLFYVWKS